MKIRSKAGTAYMHGKIRIAPGATVDLPDHEAHELLTKLPWHFEKAGEKAVEKEAPPKEPKRKRWEG